MSHGSRSTILENRLQQVSLISCCSFLSWCSSVDHDKVFTGLASLRESGINPKWLVLDDGWQSTSNSDAANGEA